MRHNIVFFNEIYLLNNKKNKINIIRINVNSLSRILLQNYAVNFSWIRLLIKVYTYLPKFTERGDRNEILLKSSIISLAVYENDPKKFLEENHEMRNIDHQIQEICCSQSHNNEKVEYFNMLNEICYLLVEDKTNKKLYIGFRGNQNVKDLIEDSKLYSKISDINGRFHS
ncbi:hypothetical protein BpHYR1_038934, partial [Brachionus plicatilis]